MSTSQENSQNEKEEFKYLKKNKRMMKLFELESESETSEKSESETNEKSESCKDSSKEIEQNYASVSEKKNITDLIVSEKNSLHYHPIKSNDSISSQLNPIQSTKKEGTSGQILNWRHPDCSYVRQSFGINYKIQNGRHPSGFNQNWRDKSFSMDSYEWNTKNQRKAKNANSSKYGWRLEYSSMDSKRLNAFSNRMGEKSTTFKGIFNERQDDSSFRRMISASLNPLEGYWSVLCDFEKSGGASSSKFDSVGQKIQEIFIEKPELFSRKPMEFSSYSSLLSIACFTKPFHDRKQVSNVINTIRKNLQYFPYVTYYLINCNGYLKSKYMSTCEGEMYERIGIEEMDRENAINKTEKTIIPWRLINF